MKGEKVNHKFNIEKGEPIMEKIKVADYEAVLATVAKYTDACKEGKS